MLGLQGLFSAGEGYRPEHVALLHRITHCCDDGSRKLCRQYVKAYHALKDCVNAVKHYTRTNANMALELCVKNQERSHESCFSKSIQTKGLHRRARWTELAERGSAAQDQVWVLTVY